MERSVNFVVDKSIYTEPSRLMQAYRGLETAVRLDLRHHFSGPTGAAYWNALCQAPEYGHRDLVQFVEDSCSQAFQAVRRDAGFSGRVSLVSLGPGNGDIDVRLLAHLEAMFEVGGYSCVDSSFELLRCAVSRVMNAPELRSPFQIEALCADFMSVAPRLPRHGAYVLTLLGGTLGNYRERALIERIKEWMTPASRLLIDARSYDLNGWNGSRELTDDEKSSLTTRLTFPARNRFTFGPVEVATTATAQDVTFAHEVNRSITVVPAALNVVTYCSNLKARMRLTGDAVVHERMPLASTTLYRMDELARWFGTMGLEECWSRHERGIGLFLLRRSQAA